MFTGGLQRGLHQLNGFITRAQFGCDCRDCGGVSAAAVASALKGQEDRATVCPPVRAGKEAPAKETPTIAPPADEPDEALARRCQPELAGGAAPRHLVGRAVCARTILREQARACYL